MFACFTKWSSVVNMIYCGQQLFSYTTKTYPMALKRNSKQPSFMGGFTKQMAWLPLEIGD